MVLRSWSHHGVDLKPLTLPGTNMEVENGPLEEHFPLQTGGFPSSRESRNGFEQPTKPALQFYPPNPVQHVHLLVSHKTSDPRVPASPSHVSRSPWSPTQGARCPKLKVCKGAPQDAQPQEHLTEPIGAHRCPDALRCVEIGKCRSEGLNFFSLFTAPGSLGLFVPNLFPGARRSRAPLLEPRWHS